MSSLRAGRHSALYVLLCFFDIHVLLFLGFYFCLQAADFLAGLRVAFLALTHKLLIFVERLVEVLLLFARVVRKYVHKVQIFLDQRLHLAEHYPLRCVAPQLLEKVYNQSKGVTVLLNVVSALHFGTDAGECSSELVVLDLW